MVAVILFVKYLQESWIYQHILLLTGLFFLLSLVNLGVVNLGYRRKEASIANYYLISTIVRLFVSVIIALLFIYFDRENSIIFAVNFIVLYLIFLGFDISATLTKLAAQSEKKD
jgi:hypothetical protein